MFSVNLGPRLKEVFARVTPTKVEPPKNEPTIAEFKDHFTDSINQLLTPGSCAEITGSKLKFDENDPADQNLI